MISFALHHDFTLTNRRAQKCASAEPDRMRFSDVADCGCGVTLSLLSPSRGPILDWGGRVEEHSFVPLGKVRLGIGFDKWFRRSQAGA